MSICLECGWIMHPKDCLNHVCNPADLPEEGKPIPKGKTKTEASLSSV